MLMLREHFKTKMRKIGLIERMLHCFNIDKLKKMTLYMSKSSICVRCISSQNDCAPHNAAEAPTIRSASP